MDYSPSSLDLTFSSGDMIGSLAPATFEITNDTIVEAAETFNISLSVVPGQPISVIQSESVAVVEIPEDPEDSEFNSTSSFLLTYSLCHVSCSGTCCSNFC